MDSLYLRVAEAAELVGLSQSQFVRLAKSGLFPHVFRGTRLLIPRKAWERWLTEQENEALAAVSGGQAHADVA